MEIPKIRLIMGQKQKGLMRSANEHLYYFFKLSNDIKEDI